jgi:hypothetical protein
MVENERPVSILNTRINAMEKSKTHPELGKGTLAQAKQIAIAHSAAKKATNAKTAEIAKNVSKGKGER